jgi:hypothetical protein
MTTPPDELTAETIEEWNARRVLAPHEWDRLIASARLAAERGERIAELSLVIKEHALPGLRHAVRLAEHHRGQVSGPLTVRMNDDVSDNNRDRWATAEEKAALIADADANVTKHQNVLLGGARAAGEAMTDDRMALPEFAHGGDRATLLVDLPMTAAAAAKCPSKRWAPMPEWVENGEGACQQCDEEKRCQRFIPREPNPEAPK